MKSEHSNSLNSIVNLHRYLTKAFRLFPAKASEALSPKAAEEIVKMKSTVFCVTSSLLFALVMNSRAQAVGFNLPQVSPDQNPLQLLGPAGEEFTFQKTGETTGGRYTLADILLPAGAGPLPHIHHNQDEWFYVESGTVQLEMGENAYSNLNIIPGINAPKEHLHTINATPGTLIYGPRYHVHGYTNVGTTPAKLLNIWTPSGMENYFKEVAQPLPDPSNPPAINPENKALFVSEAPKYGINQSSSFGQYVDTVDNNLPLDMAMDNHADQLVALLSPDVQPVPESSSPLGVLAFGAFVAILMLKRKHKLVSNVHLVLTKFICSIEYS